MTYSDYDARGHATRRVDGPFDLTSVYDRAERLTEVARTSTDGQTVSGPQPPPDGVTFAQAFTWIELGRIHELAYPRCSAGPCSTAPGAGRTVEHYCSAGRLTGVSDNAGSLDYATVTYHPNGLFHQITHENGVTVTQENDPHFRPRPRRITMAGGNRGDLTVHGGSARQ